MSFLGATMSALAPIMAAAAVAIAGLYLLRPRRPRLEVPFTRLWMSTLGRAAADSPWRRLRRLRSLLMQLGLVSLLGLALMDPRYPSCAPTRQQVVVVVDASASGIARSSALMNWFVRRALPQAIPESRPRLITQKYLFRRASITFLGSNPAGLLRGLNLATNADTRKC